MDISKANCLECHAPLSIERMVCRRCEIAVQGDVEVSGPSGSSTSTIRCS